MKTNRLSYTASNAISPYLVNWIIINNCSNHIWKYQEREINKLGFSVLRQLGGTRGIAFKHYSDKGLIKDDSVNIKRAYEILCKNGIGAGAVVTDKQFGMINTADINSAINLSTEKQRMQFKELIKDYE